MKIGIVGLGSWGTALAQHLACNNHSVLGWSREQALLTEINNYHSNKKYLKDVILHPEIRACSDLAEVCSQKVVLLAFPSAMLSAVLPGLPIGKDSVIVSAIKGFEPNSLQTVSQYIADLKLDCSASAVISGPSFASDVVRNRPCGVVLACADEEKAKFCAELFVNPMMRVFTSADVLGVEIGGSVKNVIALAAGACDSLSLGESARAGLITRGLAEIMRLAQAMGANIKTLAGLSGLGDLIMTATSMTSRNYQVGYRLGKGEKLPDIIKSIGTVAEGITTTASVQKLARKFGVRVSITDHVAMLLDGKDPRELISSLLVKPVQSED